MSSGKPFIVGTPRGFTGSLDARHAIIIFAAIVCCLPALRAGFVFDDWILIVQHPLIHAPDALRRIWFTTEAPDYYPVTWSVICLQWRVWGASPMGYHIVNVLFHAMNALLVACVLTRLNVRGAWIAALVFAVHPFNVASVAWISEQKNTLSTLFFLATSLAYLRFEDSKQWRWYAVSLGCFLISLLAKPVAIMWPVVLLGIAWWKRDRVTLRDMGRCLPFAALSLADGLLTIWIQAVQVPNGEMSHGGGFLARLAGAGYAVWFYLCKLLLPVHLSAIYRRWEIDPANLLVYVPGILLILLLALCWRRRKTWGRPVLAGIGYLVIMLFPVLGFFDQPFYRLSFVADHWLYLPGIGVIVLVVSAIVTYLARHPLPTKSMLPIGATIVIMVLGAMSWNRLRVYFDDETLWHDTIEKNPTAWLAHYNLGVVLAAQGKREQAVQEYHDALALKPDYVDALNNLGMASAQEGKIEEAIQRWQSVVKGHPDNTAAHNNLGVAYAQQANFKKAALHLSIVLILEPNDMDAHANLGMVRFRQGRLLDAVNQFETVLQQDPRAIPIRLNLGLALMRLGKVSQATEEFQQVLEVDPTNQNARNLLAQAELHKQ